jgi:hypothetical protein
LGSLVIIVADLDYMTTRTNPNITDAVTALTLAVAGIVGSLLGPWLVDEGYNDFYKCVNEYNLTITCGNGTGALIRKDAKF